jgi:hypothetical protein
MAIKIFHIVLLASVKYIVTLPYALLIGLEYSQALIAVLTGGIGGFLFFYYLSRHIIRAFNNSLPYLKKLIPDYIKNKFKKSGERKELKTTIKKFTKKNRRIIRLKNSYGFWGIIVATPLFLTIPLGAFLACKYYSHRKYLVLFMVLSIIGWAAVLSGLIHLFPNVFLD